jgi:hypothetical protein
MYKKDIYPPLEWGFASQLKKINMLSNAIRRRICRHSWELICGNMPEFEPSYPWLSIENVSFDNIHIKLQCIAYPASEQDSPDWCVDIKLYRNGNITIRNQRTMFLSYIIDTLRMVKISLRMIKGTNIPSSDPWYIGKTTEIEHECVTNDDTDMD